MRRSGVRSSSAPPVMSIKINNLKAVWGATQLATRQLRERDRNRPIVTGFFVSALGDQAPCPAPRLASQAMSGLPTLRAVCAAYVRFAVRVPRMTIGHGRCSADRPDAGLCTGSLICSWWPPYLGLRWPSEFAPIPDPRATVDDSTVSYRPQIAWVGIEYASIVRGLIGMIADPNTRAAVCQMSDGVMAAQAMAR